MEQQQEIVEEKTQETKTYNQEEVNSAIASAKKRVETKIEKDYVPRSTFEELNNKYIELTKQIRDNELKEKFISAGGNENAFKDFVATNSNVYSVEAQDLDNIIKESKQRQSYLYNQKEFSATIQQDKQQEPKSFNSYLKPGTLFRK